MPEYAIKCDLVIGTTKIESYVTLQNESSMSIRSSIKNSNCKIFCSGKIFDEINPL